MKSEFIQLRDQFREWYASLSIAEIVGNPKLIQKIEQLEKRIALMVG